MDVVVKNARKALGDARVLGIVMAVILLAGCTGGSRPFPLYPRTTLRPKVTQVAELGGYVQYVDGQDVAGRAESFELLPGCHVVGTPSVWDHTGDTGVTAVIVKTGTLFFAIPMRPGFVYSIDIDLDSWFNNTARGRAFVRAHEIDASGTTTHTFSTVRGPQELAHCNEMVIQK